jgi:hypothetical protein
MIRRVALTASFLVAGAMPALAQTHSPPHAQAYPHGPGHIRPDSATHAAMHALLHGSWTGTLSSRQGVSTGLDMSVTHDSLRKVTLALRTDRAMQAGPAMDLVLNGDTLQWTQDLAGTSCKATATLSHATAPSPDTIIGRIACEDRNMTFSLRKKAG